MGKPPLPPPSSTNKRRKNNNNNNYHSHELDAQTTVVLRHAVYAVAAASVRDGSEEECVAFFNGLKEERDRFENTYNEHIPNFDSIAQKTGRSVKECVNMYIKNQAFLSFAGRGRLGSGFLRVDEGDYFDNLEKAAKEKAAGNKSARRVEHVQRRYLGREREWEEQSKRTEHGGVYY